MNGIFTSLTQVGVLASKILCLLLASYVNNATIMNLTNLRKTFQSIAMLTPALALFLITLKNDNQILDVSLIVIAMAGMGFVCLGDSIITAEFARDLSGSVFGFTNSFGCAAGIIAPMMASFFLNRFEDKTIAWNYMFYVCIAFYLSGALIFCLFADAKPQSWAESKFVTICENSENNKEQTIKLPVQN